MIGNKLLDRVINKGFLENSEVKEVCDGSCISKFL